MCEKSTKKSGAVYVPQIDMALFFPCWHKLWQHGKNSGRSIWPYLLAPDFFLVGLSHEEINVKMEIISPNLHDGVLRLLGLQERSKLR